jgi:hypothetical protein
LTGSVGFGEERRSDCLGAARPFGAHAPGEEQLADAARTAIVGACHS